MANKKETQTTTQSEELYDEFGFCISCKGDVEGCLHSNLSQDGRVITCRNCGLVVQ